MLSPQPSAVHGWPSAFLPAVHGLYGAIEGRLSHFLPPWLRTGWQSVIDREKSLEILCHGRELNPGHGEAGQWNSLVLPLSYLWLTPADFIDILGIGGIILLARCTQAVARELLLLFGSKLADPSAVNSLLSLSPDQTANELAWLLLFLLEKKVFLTAPDMNVYIDLAE